MHGLLRMKEGTFGSREQWKPARARNPRKPGKNKDKALTLLYIIYDRNMESNVLKL